MSSSAFLLNERESEIADILSQEKLLSAEQAVQVEYIGVEPTHKRIYVINTWNS